MIKLTPPMGWNSWNTFGENINEKMIFETADVMAESGLRDKGYEYLVIDDCWSLRCLLYTSAPPVTNTFMLFLLFGVFIFSVLCQFNLLYSHYNG